MIYMLWYMSSLKQGKSRKRIRAGGDEQPASDKVNSNIFATHFDLKYFLATYDLQSMARSLKMHREAFNLEPRSDTYQYGHTY